MNIFAGIGRVIGAQIKGKVLKFNLASEQGKPCFIPCVLFNPEKETKELIDELQTSGRVVWLQGRVSSYEFEFKGKNIRKIEVITFKNCIKTI